MRVLMVTDFFHPYLGGVEKHVRSLSAGLVERGHHVAVATLANDGLPVLEVDQNVSIYRLKGTAQRIGNLFSRSDRPWAPPSPDPELTAGLRHVVEREQPDIVHGHDWMVRSFLPLRPFVDAPFVVSLHYHTLTCAKKSLMHFGTPCSGPEPLKCLRCVTDHYGMAKGIATLSGNVISSAIERKAVDVFLPVSHATALSNGLVGSDIPFEVVPNFIPSVPTAEGDDVASYVDQLPGERFLLFVGDLRREKGLNVLLEAYAGMRDVPPLVLIGKPWSDTPTTFPPNVRVFTNWPNYAVMEAWRRCAVGLVPSIWPEPCATVVLEAMASGRPVIATRIGGNPEMVSDDETGILVSPEDPIALRDAIRRLVENPALMDAMGLAGARRAVRFQSEAVVTKIEQIYRGLMQEKKSRKTKAVTTTPASPSEIRHEVESAPVTIQDPPLVSIIVNNYNYGRFLRNAIDSALAQTHERTEVIVVDDGSTDSSREIIASYGDRISAVLKENEGQASTFNAGFTHCHGDIVIYLDADDLLLPHTAAEVARVFVEHPETSKVQYRLEIIGPDGVPDGRQMPPSELAMCDGDLRNLMLRFPDDLRTPPTSGNAFAATTLDEILPIPRSLYDTAGADAYLLNLSPLYGRVRSLPGIGGRYRVHGANQFYSSAIDPSRLRQMITWSASNHEYLASHAQRLQLRNAPRSGSEILSVTFLVNRLASRKLEPDSHPIKDDNIVKLAALGMLAASRRTDVPIATRLAYMAWFLVAAGSPKSLTRWLVAQAFHVERRESFSRFLLRHSYAR